MPIGYSENIDGLPTGREFNHITQKEPSKKVSGLTNPAPDFQKGQNRGQKGA